MKYMMMMHYRGDGPAIHTWPPADIQAHIAFMMGLNAKLQKSGEFVDAQGLTPPNMAKIVSAKKGGGAQVFDGPFPESKEFIAGFWIIDVADEKRAIEIAATASAAPGIGGAPLSIPIELRAVGVPPKT